ncbi:MAG: metal ABC transporter substrate-binding protein [Phycisphaerales bacterium]
MSIVPLQGLVEPLIAAANGGETPAKPKRPPAVVSVIPPGQSEHGYEIPPSKLAALRDVDIVVVVGFGLDATIEKFLASNPPPTGKSRRIVRFADAAGLTDEEKESLAHHAHDHAHGEHCDHAHEADPHIWLDPLLVERLVRKLTAEVAEAVKADAEAKARVEEAGEELRQRVLAVHESYAVACATFTTRTVVVGHDAWRRLAGRYGLETVAIADLNASEPTAKALEHAVATIKQKRLGVVFVEPQLGERAGRRIAEAAGAKVRRLDPLGAGDWFGMMESNLAELVAALGPVPESPIKP